MSNISFDNPLLLLLGIPLLLLVTIPFAIAVGKQNRTARNTFSFVCHVLIVLAVTLCAAGMKYDAMITKTQVYVLADVSYSADRNLDVVDGYVRAVEKSLPKNTQMGLVAFGRDYQVLSYPGTDTVSVRTADRVDTSATDIAKVLNEVSNFFDDDVIKRFVVITDGVQTAESADLSAVVNKLEEKDIYIDVVYLNDNLTEDVREIQLTDVDYSASTYIGRDENAQLQIHCNNAGQTRVWIDVQCGDESNSYAHTLNKGQNLISVPLNTQQAGKYEYTVTVRAESADADTSAYNNTCLLTQRVSEKVNVLFVCGSQNDYIAGLNVYGTENVEYVRTPDDVPFTVEELCKYDEIVLCNFDVRTLHSSQQFVSSLDTAVSKFGKTLTTFGNTYVQETRTEDNAALTALGGMLPVTPGNSEQDGRTVAILLDISMSMGFTERKVIARQAVEKVLESLNQTDKVMIVTCCGDPLVIWNTQYLTNKQAVLAAIDKWELRNGTKLYVGLKSVYDEIMKDPSNHREVIILSDGMYHSDSVNECIALAEAMSEASITVSALEVHRVDEEGESSLLKRMVENSYANGKGYYKAITSFAEVDSIIDSVIEEVSQTRIEGATYTVSVARPQDETAQGMGTPNDIGGFWYSSAKSGVTTVLTAKYWKDKVTAVDVPLYAYWNYGSGRVASFQSDIASDWTSSWSFDEQSTEGRFLQNVRKTMLPKERIDSPFLISAKTDGDTTTVTVTPSAFHTEAKLEMTLTDVNGGTVTKTMYFDTENYVCKFTTDVPGRYSLHLVYDYATFHYEAERDFAISYYQEYDAYTTYNVASLYRIVSDNGEVSLTGELRMDNSDSATRSYTFSFTVPLMVFCVAAYVLDIIIRMIRWKDIRSLFVHEYKHTDIG